MSHNSYILGPNGSDWANVVVLRGYMAAFDTAQFKAISEDGGTWSFASIAELGGAGIRLTSTLNEVSGKLTFDNTAILAFSPGSILTCQAARLDGSYLFGDGSGHNATIEVKSGSGATFDSGSSLTFSSGSTLTINSGTTFSVASSAGFSGTTTFSGFAHVTGVAGITVDTQLTMGASSHLACSSGADITGTLTLNGVLAMGTGHIGYRYQNVGPDADTTFTINDFDLIQIPLLTANRTYKLANTGATKGSVMAISMLNESGAFVLTVVRDDSTVLDTIQNSGGSTVTEWFVHDGTNWKVFARTKL